MKKIAIYSAVCLVLALIFIVLLKKYSKNAPCEAYHVFLTLIPDTLDEVQAIDKKARGPHQEKPVRMDSLLKLIDSTVEQTVRKGRFKAVICMQDLDIDNDWSHLQLRGIKNTLRQYGVQVIAITDGEFDIDKQKADYAHAIDLEPDVLITIPLDRVDMAPALKRAVEKNIRLVFIDSVPIGFKHPQDYAGMVMADSYSNGRVAAEALAEALGHQGEIAVVEWENKMFTTDERGRGAYATFKQYPGIKIVAARRFSDVSEVESLTAEILSAHPNLRGMWVVWDTPALEALKEIHHVRRKVLLATSDLGHELSWQIAQGERVVGTGAQHPYQQGVAEALVAIADLAGKKTPPFVLVPGEKVTKKSLGRSWQRVFREPLPEGFHEKLTYSTQAGHIQP